MTARRHIPIGSDVELDAEIARVDGGGGSLPDSEGHAPGDILQLEAAPVAAVLSPVAADLDTDARVAKLLVLGWLPGANYPLDRRQEVPAAIDNVQFLKPDESANLFVAEVASPNIGGQVEPAWDDDAPNLGDPISDGDFTWYNAGPYSAWPFTPATWAAGTPYAAGALVWPTVPNGHLYVAFPPGPLTSDVTEPVWPTDGSYVADNDGYWWDAGQAVELADEWSDSETAIAVGSMRLSPPAGFVRAEVLAIVQADEQAYALQIYNRATGSGQAPFSVYVADDGQVNFFGGVLTDLDPQVPIIGNIDFDGGTWIRTQARDVLLAKPDDGGNASAIVGALVVLPADGVLENGQWSFAATDTDFLIKKKTAGGAIKTLTIPWD